MTIGLCLLVGNKSSAVWVATGLRGGINTTVSLSAKRWKMETGEGAERQWTPGSHCGPAARKLHERDGRESEWTACMRGLRIGRRHFAPSSS